MSIVGKRIRSRAKRTATHHQLSSPAMAKQMGVTRINNRSAAGSRYWPILVVRPQILAIFPSSQSVNDEIATMASAHPYSPGPMRNQA
jgi:hypothetical protein